MYFLIRFEGLKVTKLVSTGAGNYARVRNAQRTWYPIEVLAVSRIFAALFFRSDGSLRTNQSEQWAIN
ncbi:MAG: hypothetical protein QOJ42_5334 [Acidobacteriaceae bacterium]|nr:hypothetical protein [Acidobacteriaceae bacterium]